ncbi:hypothetical protein JCM3774_006284, partial [Rhodotorula dairenensis]
MAHAQPGPESWRRNLVALDSPHPSPLSGTQDLIGHFHLEPLYDTFLRPYLASHLVSASAAAAPPAALDTDQVSHGAASAATTHGAPPRTASTLATTTTTTTLPPVPGQVVLPSSATATAKGRGGLANQQIKATPASPATSAAGAGVAGGLKITLGGIKLAGLNPGPTPSTPGNLTGGAGTGKKPRKPKMDKSYDYMVGDVLGRISQPRGSGPNPSSLLHLVSNPDPTPCPPLHPFDPAQLSDAFALKPGGLAGFDMTIWEARDPSGAAGTAGGAAGPGGEERRRK